MSLQPVAVTLAISVHGENSEHKWLRSCISCSLSDWTICAQQSQTACRPREWSSSMRSASGCMDTLRSRQPLCSYSTFSGIVSLRTQTTSSPVAHFFSTCSSKEFRSESAYYSTRVLEEISTWFLPRSFYFQLSWSVSAPSLVSGWQTTSTGTKRTTFRVRISSPRR